MGSRRPQRVHTTPLVPPRIISHDRGTTTETSTSSEEVDSYGTPLGGVLVTSSREELQGERPPGATYVVSVPDPAGQAAKLPLEALFQVRSLF